VDSCKILNHNNLGSILKLSKGILHIFRTEIKSLKVANDNLNHTIWVTYGPQHLNTDIGSMRKLQTLLEAREDYERLCNIEKISCEELDIQVFSWVMI